MKYEKKTLTKEERQQKEKDYEKKIADLFIKAIEEEQAPWQKPWSPNINAVDRNPITNKSLPEEEWGYHGLNSMILEMTRLLELHTNDPRWITSAQIFELNQKKENQGNKIYIKKGEQATVITKVGTTFFDKDGKPIKDPDLLTSDNIAKTKTYLKYFPVFNYSQLIRYKKDENGKGINDENGNPVTVPAFEPPEKTEKKFKELIKPERLIKNTGAKIKIDQVNECFYRNFPDDTIHMVSPTRFTDEKAYYGTLLHELTHWTGSSTRLDREEARNYGKSVEWRAKEELVAEIGSYLLCKKCRISFEPRDESKSYIKSWSQALKDKPGSIMEASIKAAQATNYIADFSRDKDKKMFNENKVENETVKIEINKKNGPKR